jgi:ParB family chromosome partitioning protein
MAKSKPEPLAIPPMEFKTTFEPGTPEEAFKAISEAREGTLMMIPIDDIHPVADYNIRIHTPDYEEHVERIKDSIAQNGFYRHMPLKVYPALENGQHLLYLAGGYTRFEAAKRAIAAGAKINRLPCVPTAKGTSMDDLLIGLDRDNDGRPLTPFERGLIVKRLQALDNDEAEIANKMGITKNYVNDLLMLMAAPKALHNMVTSGEVAAALAINLWKEHGSGKKAVEALKAAGATGAAPNGQAGAPITRVTRARVGQTGGTDKPNKRLYEALIEYLVVLNSQGGSQTAIDFLLRWHDKEADAVKELAKVATPKKGKKAKKLTDEEKAARKEARKVEREKAKKKAEREAKRAAKEARRAARAAPEPI